jgi:hypothetical protein
MPNLILGAVLVGLIGWWAYRLWGEGAAVLAVGLAALEPNLVAHACVVTTDLGITLFTFLTLYLLWEYVSAPSRWLLMAVGVSTGLALVSKFSAVLLIGILPVVIGLHVVSGGCFSLPGGTATKCTKGLGSRLAEAVRPACRILLVALLVIPLFYFIHGSAAWAMGLRSQLTERQPTPAFFLGESSLHGWWTYFVVAFAIKTPVGTLLLILAALVLYRAGQSLTQRDALFLLVPPALFFAGMTFGRVNLGLRYVLPIYPFLLVFASRVATFRIGAGAWASRLSPVLVALPLALTAASSLRVSPYELAYFNELVGGPEQGHRYLSDSNLDWGQGLKGLKVFLDREKVPMIYLSYFGTAPPACHGIRYQYLPGFGHLQPPSPELLPAESTRELLAISVVNLQGIYLRDKDLYRWLERRTPVARIGYAIYVYDVTGDAEAHVRLAEVYLKTGSRHAARLELDKALALDPSQGEALAMLRKLQAKSEIAVWNGE